MDLSGQWRAAPAHDELRRTFHEPDLDNELTAICVEPAAWKQLSSVKLAA